jgi:hypothetical protein
VAVPRRALAVAVKGLAPLALSLAAACISVPQRSASLATVEDAAVTATQLQLLTYEAGRRLSARIEAAADSIARMSVDPSVSQRALLWKVSAVPLVQEASLQNDPLVAAVDLWAFTVQQAAYFTNGDGREAFGPLQPIARNAALEIENDARQTLAGSTTSGKIHESTLQHVYDWTAEHPIRGADMRRESLLSSDWHVLGIEETSIAGTLAELDRTMLGVTNRLGYMNEGLMKQARWQAELVARDALTAPRLDTAWAAVSSTVTTMDGMLRSAPALMSEQREAFFREFGARETSALAAVNQQRLATLDAIREERATVLAEVQAERIATLATADSIAQHSIAHVQEVAINLLRWTFIALVTLVAITLVALFGLVGIWRRRAGLGPG